MLGLRQVDGTLPGSSVERDDGSGKQSVLLAVDVSTQHVLESGYGREVATVDAGEDLVDRSVFCA